THSSPLSLHDALPISLVATAPSQRQRLHGRPVTTGPDAETRNQTPISLMHSRQRPRPRWRQRRILEQQEDHSARRLPHLLVRTRSEEHTSELQSLAYL